MKNLNFGTCEKRHRIVTNDGCIVTDFVFEENVKDPANVISDIIIPYWRKDNEKN